MKFTRRSLVPLVAGLLHAAGLPISASAAADPVAQGEQTPASSAPPAQITDAAAQDRCRDSSRKTPAAADASERQIDPLGYECILLDNGKALWVGEGGSPSAPPVLLIHGLGSAGHLDWRNALPALLPTYRVIAIDLPGFGASEALPAAYSFDALAAVLDEVLRRRRVERSHVVGHSLGAALSLHFAAKYPQRVDRLVLADVAGILHESVYIRHLTELDTSPGSGSRLAVPLKRHVNFLRTQFLRRVDGKIDLATLARNPRIHKALLGDRPATDSAISLVLENFTEAIRSTRAPTTLIWGREDRIAPLRTGTLLSLRMPAAQLHVLDGVGHVPMSAAPEAFNALLTQALSTPPVPPNPGTPATTPATETQGDVVCKSKARLRYTGRFKSLRIVNCAEITIEDVTTGRLQIDDSTAELRNVTVTSDRVPALIVRDSVVSGTAIRLEGPIALRADDSEVELAGATLRASRQAFHLSSSARIYFSVSEVDAPDYRGDAHEIWTRDTAKAKARK